MALTARMREIKAKKASAGFISSGKEALQEYVEIVNSKGNRNVELSVDTKRGSLRVMENKPGSKGNRCGGCPTTLSVLHIYQ